jgi:hypothetical protein
MTGGICLPIKKLPVIRQHLAALNHHALWGRLEVRDDVDLPILSMRGQSHFQFSQLDDDGAMTDASVLSNEHLGTVMAH